MKTRTTFLLFISTFLCFALGIAWTRAQENAASAEAGDKWVQVQENNKQILASLEEVEKNLMFIKARSMSGGRQ
jgi:hypothetical protein